MANLEKVIQLREKIGFTGYYSVAARSHTNNIIDCLVRMEHAANLLEHNMITESQFKNTVKNNRVEIKSSLACIYSRLKLEEVKSFNDEVFNPREE